MSNHLVMETIPSTVLALEPNGPDLAPTWQAPPSDPAGGGASSSTNKSRYSYISLLGEGGMGRVDRMRDEDLLRDVAVKHLLPELRKSPESLGQFLWESRVTSYLDHPNIVPVHDLGTTPDGALYFTMKFVRGQTLEDEIARWHDEPIPMPQRLRMFLQVCNAISYAHAGGVLHRDLKPANILLGEYGEVLVSDWGLAIALPGELGASMRTMMPTGLITRSAGTPVYMSPEQAQGARAELDERSDLYTLGVILYELATLHRPFRGELAEVLKKVSTGDCPPITKMMPSVSPTLAAVVTKAMSLDPKDRYPSAAALAHDIETVLDGRTPDADKASVVVRAARYYLAHDPAIGRLRVIDIDMWIISAVLFGIALALGFLSIAQSYWWGFAILSVIAGAPSFLRYWRFRRESRELQSVPSSRTAPPIKTR